MPEPLAFRRPWLASICRRGHKKSNGKISCVCAFVRAGQLAAREKRDAVAAARRGEGFDSNNASAAARFITGDAPYYALHVRRGDFQFKDVKISASAILKNIGGNALIPRGAVVYISTDDPKGVCEGCTYKKKACPTGPAARDITGCIEDPSWTAFTTEAGWEVG